MIVEALTEKSGFELLKLMGNRVNAAIIIMIRRSPMNPRDISYNLNKKEGDIVRRLKKMENYGLVKSEWGSRLGQSVKLYYLITQNIGVSVNQDGIEITFTKKDKVEKTGIAESKKNKKAQKLVMRPIGSTEFFDPLEKDQLITIVGRNEELEYFENKAINFFFIVGIAGVGKTTLVKKFLAESASKANNNMKVFWHTFREIDALAFLLGKIAGFLSTYNSHELALHFDNRTNSPSMDNDRVGATLYDSSSLDVTINALNSSNCVLVFDDYQKVKDENISVFLRHLQQNFKNKLIIISRSRPPFFLDSVMSKEIVLSGLPFDDAKRMITDFQVNLDTQVLRSIWKKTEGHPMALKILSSLMTTGKKEVLEIKGEEEDLAYSQIASIDKLRLYLQREILETLSEEELDILLTLSIFRNPVKAGALKRKSSSNSKIGRRRSLDYLLHSLEKKMLINRTSNHEYHLHDMLKEILYSMLAYPEETHRFASQYYLTGDTTDNIVEALYHLTKSQDKDRIFAILEEEMVSERYRFIEEGYAASLVDIFGQINISNVNKSKLVYLYAIQGKALSMLERWDEANVKLCEAIKIARSFNNDNNLLLAYSLRTLSESFYLQGDFLTVEKNLLQAAHLFQKHQGMEKTLHDVYMKLARLYFATGRSEESKSYSDLAQSLIKAK